MIALFISRSKHREPKFSGEVEGVFLASKDRAE